MSPETGASSHSPSSRRTAGTSAFSASLADLWGTSGRPSAAALVLALGIPLLFLHPHYQPSLTIRSLSFDLTDITVAAVVAAALVTGIRNGFAPLRDGLRIWLPMALFVVMVIASIGYARHLDPAYAVGPHVVSSLKFFEVALLAPAVPLLLRGSGDVRALFFSVGAWSVVLSAVAVLQFLGLVDEFEGKRPGQREPSLIGVHELGAYSAAALTLGITSILIRDSRWTTYVVVVAGGIGVAVAAALDSVTGLIVACLALTLLTRRTGRPHGSRIGIVAAIVLVVGIGAISLRSSAISAALRSIGLERQTTTTSEHVQSYAHRTLLGYIGLRIWFDHPILGVGWQASKEPGSFEPQLAAAHRRFPHEPPRAFPGPDREWGVQNGVIQILADHGVVGLLVVASLLATVLYSAAKAAVRSPWDEAVVGLVAFAWVCVACAAITGVGVWPGFSGNTLLWLSIGLAACAGKLAGRPV